MKYFKKLSSDFNKQGLKWKLIITASLFEEKIRFYLKKNFKFFWKKCIFWRQIFLENFVSCQYISLTLATLKWNDRIPSICFSIKIRFFKIKLWWKWKKNIEKPSESETLYMPKFLWKLRLHTFLWVYSNKKLVFWGNLCPIIYKCYDFEFIEWLPSLVDFENKAFIGLDTLSCNCYFSFYMSGVPKDIYCRSLFRVLFLRITLKKFLHVLNIW